MRIALIVGFLALLAGTACAPQKTCPVYSKANPNLEQKANG